MTPEEQAERDELERLELMELEERERQEQKPSDIGGVEAFGLGLSSALSPIAKYGAAAGIKARTAIEDLARGKPSLGVPFDIATETAEEQFEAARKQRPGAYYSGMGTGIVGQGVGAAKSAVPSLLKGIGIGAGTGAAYSAGDVPIEEIKKDPFAPVGPAIVGGSIGAAIPAGITALGTQRQAATAGATAAAKELSSEPLQLFGIPKAISEGVKTTYGAAREPAQMKEVVRQIAPELPKPTLGSQILSGGAVTPQEEAQFLLNLLQEGKTPAKEFFTQKATQLYPGQTGPQQLRNVLDIPLEQRVQARQFDPSAMGKQLQPQAEAAKQALSRKGAAYKELQELASQEYKRTQLPSVSNAIKLAKGQFERPGTSALARSTVEEIDMIINQGSALPRYGVTEGPLKSANAQEAYKRLQAAREYADRAIRKNPQDLSVQDVLMPLREKLDDVLKTSPSKIIADALYAKGKKVETLGIKPLEIPLGERERVLSGKAIQSALGDTQKGEKLSLGIEQAREFTKEFAQQLGPKEAAKIDQFFNALEGARSVAEQKRILDQLKFSEGPSGAAIRAGIEKLQQTIKPSPSGASMFRAAPEYLQSVDAFMSENAGRFFGKSFDKLTGKEQFKLVNAYQWFKENPNATPQELDAKIMQIIGGKRK
jgi:hypothetical protein